MNRTLRTICSLLLSLSLAWLPMQSFAMMHAMGNTQLEQPADTDSGCEHGSGMIEKSANCCADNCGTDCDSGCSKVSQAATLFMADSNVSITGSASYPDSLSDLHSRAPSPPLPPPLI